MAQYKLTFQEQIHSTAQKRVIIIEAEAMSVSEGLFIFRDHDEDLNGCVEFAWYPIRFYSCVKTNE